MLTSFVILLLIFVLIGLSSTFLKKQAITDYYTAGQSIPGWLVGLSAVATNNSGYMFIGLIGYTYATGLSTIWLMIGWVLGDFCASQYLHNKFRQQLHAKPSVSYAEVLSSWQNSDWRVLQKLIGSLIILFLLAYAAAQLVAGSKALSLILEWPAWASAIIGAVIIGAYCLAGGIRASIWTDAAQSTVMILGMFMLVWASSTAAGGLTAAWNSMSEIPNFTSMVTYDADGNWSVISLILFVLGWFIAGFSVIGQPHIMSRFMSLKSDQSINEARIYYYLWFIAFWLAASCVGLYSRILLPEASVIDNELALPMLANLLLPDILVGLILAAIFAATISTADSIILSCSASLSRDLMPKVFHNYFRIKLATLTIIIVSLLLALSNNQSVFDLVIFAWSGLGSAFAPLVAFFVFGGKTTQKKAITGVVIGFSVALGWRILGLHGYLYEGFPAGLIALTWLYFSRNKDQH